MLSYHFRASYRARAVPLMCLFPQHVSCLKNVSNTAHLSKRVRLGLCNNCVVSCRVHFLACCAHASPLSLVHFDIFNQKTHQQNIWQEEANQETRKVQKRKRIEKKEKSVHFKCKRSAIGLQGMKFEFVVSLLLNCLLQFFLLTSGILFLVFQGFRTYIL